ncbi:hypothetical protein EH223_09100 [candidate division KSB1 bacterium]|nr:hypothetical protein [candidate division KSB1 bacterium]RQW03761.1 MAG: hypothetical protein EH223_09100 [candidate division KSB1 bacterium]
MTGRQMIENNILDLLENRIYQALKKISDQQQKINTLIHEKEKLEQALSSRDAKIAQLEREVSEAESSADAQAVLEYQEREEKLKNRLEELVQKIDKVRLLE